MSKKTRVLLVDDDREIVRGMSIRLRAAGHDVTTAHDGQAGVEAAISSLPDAIVLDLRMPVMDGFTALGKLQENPQTRGIPVVVVSANAVERVKRQVLDSGARFFLEKPYDAAGLLAAIDRAIDESSSAGGQSEQAA